MYMLYGLLKLSNQMFVFFFKFFLRSYFESENSECKHHFVMVELPFVNHRAIKLKSSPREDHGLKTASGRATAPRRNFQKILYVKNTTVHRHPAGERELTVASAACGHLSSRCVSSLSGHLSYPERHSDKGQMKSPSL